MALVTLPSTPQASSTQWKLVMPAQTNISGWTGARQTLASGRGWWECTYSLPTVTGSDAAAWRSFVVQMRGGANEARIPIDGKAQSALPNTALVNGAGQIGRSLVTDGWPVSTTVLTAGQFVTIGDQLLQLTADITSDGSGNATITFEPPIRTSPANDAVIEYKNPYALMHFLESPAWNYDTGVFYGFSFEFREAF